MKNITMLAILSITLTSNLMAVETGDSRTNVISELGEPKKIIKSGDYEQLIYKRGKIELLEGTVVSANIISTNELAKQEALMQQELQKAEQTANQLHTPENIRQGIADKIKLVHSANFSAMTGNARLNELRKFGRKHPGVDITQELLQAMDDAEREKPVNTEPQVDYQKYQELRARLQAAEDREREDDMLNAQHYLMMRDTIAPPWGYYNTSIYTGYTPPTYRPIRPRPPVRPRPPRPIVRP